MRKLTVTVLVSVVTAACGGAAAPSTVEPPSTTASSAVSPLVIASVDFDGGVVVVRNDGSTDYDLAGHWLCNRPSYTALPEVILSPGEIVEVAASAIGITASEGEIGLYTSRDFGDSTAIVRYVQWGSDGHGRTSVAVEGGVWTDGDFVDNTEQNLTSTGSNPVSAADWTTN